MNTQITSKSRKVEIAQAIAERDDASESYLMKSTKAELLELWNNPTDADAHDIDEAEAEEVEEVVEAEEEAEEAEEVEEAEAQEVVEEAEEKPVTRKTGYHLANQMKSIRGTLRGKIEKLEADGNDEPLEFVFYQGSLDAPTNTLHVRLTHEARETIDPTGETITTLVPVFQVNDEQYGQYDFYKVVRKNFSL